MSFSSFTLYRGSCYRRTWIVLCVAACGSAAALGQAAPTATQNLRMAVFGGVNGTDTRLQDDPRDPNSATAHNVGITAGFDLGFRTPLAKLHTALEVRGTYPVSDDMVAGEKNALVGVRVGPYIRKIRPYGDVFYGRGSINYSGYGYPIPDGTLYYTSSFSNVFAGGGGVDLNLNERFAIKLDVQLERYAVPVVSTGSLLSRAGTVGVVYRFDFDKRLKLDKAGMPRGKS